MNPSEKTASSPVFDDVDQGVRDLMVSTIDRLVKDCHHNAVLHGFYNQDPSTINYAEKIALLHSELSEMLESMRKGKMRYPDEHCPDFTNVEIEAADVLIRMFDFAGLLQLRLGAAVLAKHEYNKTRPYKHGKAF